MSQVAYLPPDWIPYEYVPLVAGNGVSRWMPSWQGPVGEPAEQVCLGWSAGNRRTLVGTLVAARSSSESDFRRTAALFAFGGDQLKPNSARDSQEIYDRVEHLVAERQLWASVAVMIDGRDGLASFIHCDEDVLLGYAVPGRFLVTIACVGVEESDVRIARMTSGDVYPVNPLKPATLADVSTQPR